MKSAESIAVVGGGLVGSLLARMLARRGYPVCVYERRHDPSTIPQTTGRSTHLVISARGWKALDAIGARPLVQPMTQALRGRRIHTVDSGVVFQPYGQDGQVIHAIHRNTLNRLLARLCVDTPGVEMHYRRRCVQVDAESGTLLLEDVDSNELLKVTADRIFAADGAFSNLRLNSIYGERVDYTQTYEPFGYKELTIAPQFAAGLEPDAMHAWPRGEVSFFAFPNPDSSFTATLLAPFDGPNGFASLQTKEDVFRLFAARFPDVDPRHFAQEVLDNPCSSLVSVRCAPWTFGGRVALIGDAAHAMVPFLGQGMNAGFEDCTVLCELLDEYDEDFDTVLGLYEVLRRPNCDAVTTMSSRAFEELTRHVGDPRFHLRKQLEAKVHSLYPERFIPPYEHIAFTHVPYAQVLDSIGQFDALIDALMVDLNHGESWYGPSVEQRIHDLVRNAEGVIHED